MKKIINNYSEELKGNYILVKKINIDDYSIVWYIGLVDNIDKENNIYQLKENTLYVLKEDMITNSINKDEINPIFWNNIENFQLLYKPFDFESDANRIYIFIMQETYIISEDEYKEFSDRFINLNGSSPRDYKVIQNDV